MYVQNTSLDIKIWWFDTIVDVYTRVLYIVTETNIERKVNTCGWDTSQLSKLTSFIFLILTTSCYYFVVDSFCCFIKVETWKDQFSAWNDTTSKVYYFVNDTRSK